MTKYHAEAVRVVEMPIKKVYKRLGIDDTELLAMCVVRQFAREMEEDFSRNGQSFMADVRNLPAMSAAYKLMQNKEAASAIIRKTRFFIPCGAEKFNTLPQRRIQAEIEAAVASKKKEYQIELIALALEIANMHRSIQESFFEEVCYPSLINCNIISSGSSALLAKAI